MNIRVVCISLCAFAILCVADRVEAQCFCQTHADCPGGTMCLGGQCEGASGPVPCCPLSGPLPDACALLQSTDCLNPSAGEICLPQSVQINPATGQAEAQACDCFENTLCGPVAMVLIPGTNEYDLRCQGSCPSGQVGLCQIHFDGMPTGLDHVSSAAVPSGATVTCSCLPVQQPEACCFADGTCANGVPPADCQGGGGTPQGPGSVCQGIEACCIASLVPPVCLNIDRLCCDELGGVPQGPGSSCGTAGACCIDTDGDGTSDSCQVLDPLCCAAAGGSFQGGGTSCQGDQNMNGIDDACEPTPQTCPLPSDPAIDPCAALQSSQCALPAAPDDHCFPVCVNFSAAGPVATQCACRGPNDCHFDFSVMTCTGGCPDPTETCVSTPIIEPDGTDTVCCECEVAPPQDGACCYDADGDGLPDTCALMTAAQCDSVFGIFQGIGSVCLGVEACCVSGAAGQLCVNIDRLCCDDLGGVPQGPGSMCGNVGACCYNIDDGPLTWDTCVDEVDELCCVSSGGVPAGSDCERVSCCLPGGFCQEADPECCIASGGTGNPNAVCGMDANANGIDDACEEPCPLPTPPPALDPCSALQSSDCTEPDGPDDLCRPTRALSDSNGNTTVLECSCRGMDECYLEIPFGGTFPDCVGNVCPDGLPCLGIRCLLPDGTVETRCCDEQACCYDDDGDGVAETCDVLTPLECAALGGTPQGTCSTCQGTGACCYDANGDGTLDGCDVMDRTCCEGMGGLFQGLGTVCQGDLNGNGQDDACEPPGGVCPEPAGQDICHELLHEDCVEGMPGEECQAKVFFIFEGQPVLGKCACFDDGDCGPVQKTPTPLPEVFELSCPGDCPPPERGICQIHINGAPTGNITMLSNAIPDGSMVRCNCGPAPEACCLPDGTCVNGLLPTDCSAQGGTPQGPGSNCLGLEACCLNVAGANTCVEVDQLCCDDLGGTPQGPGSTCGDTGACCYDADGDGIAEVCQITAEACCDDLGGTFQGVGTVCQGTGACCFGITGGGCVQVDGICCDDLLGVFQGAGTLCLGDNDGNGLDDVCEQPDVCALPLPPAVALCSDAQQAAECTDGAAGELCEPRVVLIGAGGQPVAELCDCFAGDCGAVRVTPEPDNTPPLYYDLSCPGPCPVPPPGNDCQIHVNGLPSGQGTLQSNAVPAGSVITCDCVTCVPPPADMTAWWPLDETSGTSAEEAINGNDGTHFGGPSPLAGQFVDNSLCFNGLTDYVEVPDAPALNFGTGNFSVDAWIRPASVAGIQLLVDKRVEAASVTGYSFFLVNNQIAFQIADGVGSSACTPCPGSPSSCANYTSPGVVVANAWQHVAVTVERNSTTGLRFYHNGVQVGPALDPTCHLLSVSNPNPLRIGSRSSTVSGLFDGCIDEVELFDQVVPAAVINTLYQAGAAGKCKCEPLPDGSGCQPIGCSGAAHECRPACVNYHPGAQPPVRVLDCDCLNPQQCHVEVLPGVVPFCDGVCAPGETCVQTVVPNPVLGGEDICCECLPPGACCFSADPDSIPETCALMSADACTALDGIFHGPGSACLGSGACCFGAAGGSCVVVDKICCGDIPGEFMGCGSTCHGDSDGDGLDDRCECPADLNHDGSVNAADLAAMLGSWGAGCSQADLNHDDVVNAADLAQLLGAWGPC